MSHLSSWPARRRISTRLASQKTERAQYEYNQTPHTAAVLQFFNKRQNIPMLDAALNAGGFDETIVLEDGSVDDSINEWIIRRRRPNDIIVRTNDLYEIIGYDRAIRSTRADLVFLLQDDDDLPRNREWTNDIIRLFASHPKLAYLGLNTSMEILPRLAPPTVGAARDVVKEGIHDLPGIFRQKYYERGEPGSFQFVMATVRAPVVIRRSAFLEIGGFDLDFAPYCGDDVDNCMRLWLAGWQVGAYSLEVRRDLGLGGMRAFNGNSFGAQAERAWHRLYAKHGNVIASGDILDLVASANASLVASRTDTSQRRKL